MVDDSNLPSYVKHNFVTVTGRMLYMLYPISQTDIAVAEALTQMEAMGFNAEGEWLRNMMYEKKADVASVVDLILSIKSRHGQ